MTQKEIDREIDELEARKMMFAERYLSKLMELNEDIQNLRALSRDLKKEDKIHGRI